jgi:putative DNA methylase
MIERWFPCAEVSERSAGGWGSGNLERNLFTWFAARPTAQAKAAVICSLLPWPEGDAEQKRLQDLVRRSLTGRYEARDEIRAEILKTDSHAMVLDPFSGRGMIPLEAARLGLHSYAIDYSPMAVLGSELLADYPFRDWSLEPALPFGDERKSLVSTDSRLIHDVESLLSEIGHRLAEQMSNYYPKVGGLQPWAYLWAVTLPCQECGRRFPLIGAYELRRSNTTTATKNRPAASDPGQSFYVEADSLTGKYKVIVHEGPPRRTPTLSNVHDSNGRKIPGKSAVCPFCNHAHTLASHRRLVNEGHGRDALLVVAETRESGIKSFRVPTEVERRAVADASIALRRERAFSPGLSARPEEGIAPGNNNIIGPSIYGARTYGDMMCDRQTLSFVCLSRIIAGTGAELLQAGFSNEYARALTGYAAANLARKIKYSTRGATPQIMPDGGVKVNHIFANEGSLTFSYDFLETGIGEGPGTWASLIASSVTTLRSLMADAYGEPTKVMHGSATLLPYRPNSIAAVVTDPPYDEMIAYSDASDLFFVWAKRALSVTWPELQVTADSYGTQDKSEEIIVKRVRGDAPNEHRTRQHYDTKIAEAFREMRRVVDSSGVVTIVFGHGEPEVWQRLLSAIQAAGLTMTASWPARTEAGGQQGKANIETTLTMACRPAQAVRVAGRRAAVESEVRAEIKRRYPEWERWGLAPTDMLMAAAGPAMEVVGHYSEVLDARGEAVPIDKFLPLARAAVQEAMAVEVDHHPLETFDARTRFALWWVRLFGRGMAPKSELRWQTLAASLDLSDVRDLVPDVDKGCQFVFAAKHEADISPESSVIDVVLALGRTSDQGLAAMGDVLAASGREPDDAYLWSAASFLADRLPDSDPDAIALTRVLRNRAGVGSAAVAAHIAGADAARERERQEAQMKLF